MDPDQARRFLRFGKSDIQSSSNPQFSFYVDSEGPFHLNVHTDPTDESAVSGATGIAFVDDIHPGQPPLTVLLRPARTVHGQVVDDLGHPIPAFSISACPASDAAAAFLGEAIHSNFHSEDGVFALGGLAERVWTFSADALGVHGPESEPVEVPNSAVLVLVVPRPAELSGVVLEPSGTPAAFAEVDPCSGGSPKTDASGRSRLTQVEPGTVRLTASSKSWAPSEPLSVEVKPGEKLGDLVLRLRKGGRIAGSVFDADGHEESGSVVWIESADGEDSWSLESDAGGRFESGILVPGDYTVSRRSDRIGPDDQERENLTESVSVTVIENQVTSVVIGRAR